MNARHRLSMSLLVLALAALACNMPGATTPTGAPEACAIAPDPSIVAQQPDWRAAFGCPTSNPRADAPVTWQAFEHGYLLDTDAEATVITVLFGDGRLAAYPDDWQPGAPSTDPSLVPPQGLYQPSGSFGWVWRSHPDVANTIGWATMDGVQAGTGLVQEFAGHQTVVVYAPNGDLLALFSQAAQWARLRVKTVPGYYGTP